MKKLISLLLAALLLCSCAAALSDPGCMALKQMLQTDGHPEGAQALGTPQTEDAANWAEYKQVIAIVDLRSANMAIALVGPDEAEKWEFAIWTPVPGAQLRSWLAAFVHNFTAINESVSGVGAFEIMLYVDGQDPQFIDDQAAADAALAALE